jgi:hypothetical protein
MAINSGSAVTLHGDVTTSADQTWTGNLLFASDASLSAGTGSIAVSGNVNGGTHNSRSRARMPARRRSRSAAPSATSGTFAADGNASLGGNVTSTGTQTYAGAVALTGDAVLDAGIGQGRPAARGRRRRSQPHAHERQCRGRCGASRQYGRQHGAAHA